MSKRVLRRRGTESQHDSFTGAEGELTVNTTDHSAHIHDGSTAGGFKTYGEGNPPSFSDVTGTSGVFTASNPPSFSDVTGSISDGQVPESAVTQHGEAAVGTRFPSVNADVTATDEQMNAVLTPYATATVELGGDFSAGESVQCERIGDRVTITGIGVLAHLSTSMPSSAASVIPDSYRPSAEVANAYTYNSGLAASIYVTAVGTVSFQYIKPNNSEFASQRTDTTYAPSITYVIT